jgi:hypothetical protein
MENPMMGAACCAPTDRDDIRVCHTNIPVFAMGFGRTHDLVFAMGLGRTS